MMYSRRRNSPFARRRRGTTVIEYLLLGAIIAVATTVGIEQLSEDMSLSFHLVDRSFAGETATLRPRNEQPVAATAQPVADPRRPSWSATAILVVAVVGWLIERRSRSAGVAESPLPTRLGSPSGGVAPSDVLRLRYAQKRLRILRELIEDNHKLLPTDLKVGDLMTEEVKKATPDVTVGELRRLTSANGFRHILVCNEKGTLVGVVSDRDLHGVDDALTANDIMAKGPTTVTRHTLVTDAITLLLHGRFSSLPVVDDGRLVGILTTTDVVMMLQCAMLAVEQMVLDLRTSPHPAAS